MSPSILAISFFFHLVATVVWIGGLLVLTVMVWPEARRVMGESPALEAFMARLRKRFMPLTHLSLAVLTATGLTQMTANAHYEGTLTFTNTWTQVILLKHLAVGGMLLGGLALQLWVLPALERASLLVERGKGDPQEWRRLRQREIRLTWLNLILGILVLGFTAWATAL